MYAEFAYFDGPRSAEVQAASDHAGRDRIQPAIEADPQMQQELVSLLVVRKPDGAQTVIVVTRTEAGLTRAREIIMSTELLPDEDPTLLSEPDRVEVFEVVDTRAYTPATV
jgi:hypothetical protein